MKTSQEETTDCCCGKEERHAKENAVAMSTSRHKATASTLDTSPCTTKCSRGEQWRSCMSQRVDDDEGSDVVKLAYRKDSPLHEEGTRSIHVNIDSGSSDTK
jgi:hypothetical protein